MSPESTVEAYKNDQLDILDLMIDSPAKIYKKIAQNYPADLRKGLFFGLQAMAFGTNLPPMDDIRVRRAFAHALDIQAIRADPHIQADGGMVPPGMPGHVPGNALPYDLEKARRLLAEAGYPDGHGLPELQGLAPWNADVELFTKYWGDGLGALIHWRIVDWNEFVFLKNQSVKSGDAYHFIWTGWFADYADPFNFLHDCLKDNGNWQHEPYDRILNKAKQTRDHDERMALYRQAEQILVDECPLFPLIYLNNEWLQKPWIKNYQPSVFDTLFTEHIVIEPHS